MLAEAQLFAEHWAEGTQQCAGDNGSSFRRWMDPVLLERAGLTNEVLVDHRHEHHMVLHGKFAIHRVELADVIRPVIRRQRNACEEDSNVGCRESGEHRVQVPTSVVEGKATQSIVTAEFKDHDVWMEGEHRTHAGDGIFRGGSAGAQIGDSIVVAELVKATLEKSGVGLIGREAQSRRDAVAVADNRPGLHRNKRKTGQKKRD